MSPPRFQEMGTFLGQKLENGLLPLETMEQQPRTLQSDLFPSKMLW